MKISMGCLIVFAGMFAGAQSRQAIESNNKAVERFQAESYGEAVPLLLQALKEEPDNAGIHLNLGIAYELLESPEKALKSYALARRLAEQQNDERIQFYSQANTARVHAANGRINEALEFYQKALQLQPASREVKINIELLAQQNGGQGGSGNQSQNQKDDQKQNDQNKRFKQNPKPTPIPFESKKLNKNDVKKIFEELLQQEQRIRKDFDRKSGKDKPREKDW